MSEPPSNKLDNSGASREGATALRCRVPQSSPRALLELTGGRDEHADFAAVPLLKWAVRAPENPLLPVTDIGLCSPHLDRRR